MFGYPRNELLGQLMEVLVPPRFRQPSPEPAHLVLSATRNPGPSGAGRDLFGLRKDGSEFPVEIGLNPIETEEGTMVLSAVVDISERKQSGKRVFRPRWDEKDLLLGEIHHRVKNNLQIVHSLLGLQSTNIKDEIVLGMMQESQNRIRSMALIHETLYKSKDFARVDFRSFLDMLVPTLISSYAVGNERIAVSINSGEVFLPINAAIPCGLVVNELISNALKHAFPRRYQRWHRNRTFTSQPRDGYSFRFR